MPKGLPYGFKYAGKGDLGGFPVYFDTNIDNSRAKTLVTYMREGYFMDHDTKEVKFKTVTYNPDAKVFVSSEIKFVWNTGGRILMEQLIQVFSLSGTISTQTTKGMS